MGEDAMECEAEVLVTSSPHASLLVLIKRGLPF